jgi:3-dehydroquinate synthase
MCPGEAEPASNQAIRTRGAFPALSAVVTEHRLQRFMVRYDFPVVFTSGLLEPDNPVLVETLSRSEPHRQHRCILFIDDGLLEARPLLGQQIGAYARRHSDRMALVVDPIPVPGGEKIKLDLRFVEEMQRHLFDHRIDRHSYVIAIGGGAVLDAVGFVAAITHRGIRHIRVPSTVLSQNDSGVGVKNGIDLYDQKNFVGTFAPPAAVLNDLDFIETLSPRDKIAGMAEAVKVALIRDGGFFEWLERNAGDLMLFKRPAMAYMIRRCAELHMDQIAHGGDPFETGTARPLDFGHWAAHRLESLTRYSLRHGEAVAIGIALDARYSVLSGLLDASAEDRIRLLLEHLGFRLWDPTLERMMANGRRAVLEGLREFREHLGGELTITLLCGIGTGIEVHEIDEGLMIHAISDLKERSTS